MGNKQVKVAIGMRSSYFAPIVSEPLNAKPVYSGIVDMGAAVKGYLTITTTAFDVYGDDENLVHDEKFLAGALDAETTLNDLERNALVYGHLYADGAEHSGKDDSAPMGGYGYIEPFLKKDKSVVYRSTFLRRVSANAASEKSESDTKKGSLDPKMNAINYTVYSDNTGNWRDRMEFATEAQADAWLRAQFGTATGYVVSVTCHGGSVEPAAIFVESGEDAVLTFSSAPSAVFDNGQDVTASLSGAVYTISGVSAAHQVIAIW